MWRFMVQFQNKNGFTLIEFILGITLISMLILTIFSIFTFVDSSVKISEENNDIFLNGQYGLEYIKNEILISDKIISSSKFSDLNKDFPTNIGFVLMVRNKNKLKFITYYIENNNLVRIACEVDKYIYPNSVNFKGFNQICTNLNSFKGTNIDLKNKILHLKINMVNNQTSSLNFKSTILLRPDIEF